MKELNLYTIDDNKRYKFMATVGTRITDVIYPKHFGVRLPEYWNKERIILNNVKILIDNKFVDFEPTIKMELGKQFKTTRENDIITFNARVGIIDTYCGGYDEDDRGEFCLDVSKYVGHGHFETIWERTGTKNELENIVQNNFSNISNIYCVITCNRVRRLISPSQLKIMSKEYSQNVA